MRTSHPATAKQPKKSKKDAAVGAVAPKLRVGFVLAPRFTLTAFAGFVDALRLAADEADRSHQIECQWTVLGHKNEPIVSSSGVEVTPWGAMVEPRNFDYIVVVGGLIYGGQKVLPGTYPFLRAAARAGVPLVGLCTGSFILARAGLLDGYEVCVTWFHRDEFASEFPKLRMQSNKVFVMDRDRLTCSGGVSVVHVAAHLIEKHCGRPQALKSIRLMVEEPLLPSNAWQPEAVVTRQARDSLVREAMLLIEQDLAEQASLATLAASLSVSIRQLERRFVTDVGMTPREYRLRLRFSRAKWMVANTDRSMTEIGLECGFNDAAYFSHAFKNHFGVRPSDARRAARS